MLSRISIRDPATLMGQDGKESITCFSVYNRIYGPYGNFLVHTRLRIV